MALELPADITDPAALVRAGDPDRWFAILLSPRPLRADLLAIAALGVEMRRIAQCSKDPWAVEFRLQWWREALEQPGAGRATGHPLADAVRATLLRHGLPSAAVIDVIDVIGSARFDAPPVGMDALLKRLDLTDGTLMALTAHIVGAAGGSRDRLGLDATATAAGRAHGLASRLWRLPDTPERELGWLPAEATTSVQELLGATRAALAVARASPGWQDRRLRPAFLPLAMVGPYLAAVEQRLPDPHRSSPHLLPIVRPWRMWTALRFGRL